MPPISRDQVLMKAKLLAEEIAQQEDVRLYQQAEHQIKHHKRVQSLITQIKKKQQELVNAKHIKKTKYIKKLEEELDILNKELHQIPIVDQYQQTQAEVNKYLQSLIRLIKEQISKNIPIDDEDISHSDVNNIF